MDYSQPEGMSLLYGDFGNGFYTCASLLGGDFYCRTGDEIGLIYRDDSADTFDYLMPCFVYDDGDATATITLQDLDVSKTWRYVAKSISVGGSIGPVSNICFMTVDASGDEYPAPNIPINVTATAILGAIIRVSWQYDSTGEQNIPTTFSVYNNTVDPNTALGPTNYRTGKTKYYYDTSALTHGVNYEFVVRSSYAVFPVTYTSGASETVDATADEQGPAAISDFNIEVVEP